jgi:hypothetical protein
MTKPQMFIMQKIHFRNLMKDDSYLKNAANDYLHAVIHSNSALITIQHILFIKYDIKASMKKIEAYIYEMRFLFEKK